MSDDGWAECCGEILLAIGLALLFAWCEENPLWCTAFFLGIMMAGLPFYWFIMECKQRIKGSIVVGYFLSFFAWIMAITAGVIGGLFAVLGVCAFIGIGIIGLLHLIVRGKMKKRKEQRKKALAWELEDQLTELKERLSEGVITQEEYEQKQRRLREALIGLREQLDIGTIYLAEYDQKKIELLKSILRGKKKKRKPS